MASLFKSLVEQRWFPTVDLILVLAAIVLWLAGLSWQPLLVAFFPWALRLAVGRAPFRTTAFDFPIVLFLVSAAIGVWAAYDSQGAWVKFWLLVAAVALYYALAGQPQRNLWPLSGVIGMAGLGIGLYFLLSHDWQDFPAKLASVNTLLVRWSDIRPDVDLSPLAPNVAASLMAITAPFLIAWCVHSWHQARRGIFILAAVAAVLVAVLIFASTSRGAWMALVTASGVVALIWLGRRAARQLGFSNLAVVAVLTSIVLILLVAAVLIYPGGAVALVDSLPGPSSSSGRLELSRDTLNLISDFPITGAGLGSFPGLYSHYILVIPFFFLPNGHNIFLDVTLEQGFLGAVALLTIFGGSFLLLIKDSANKSKLKLLRLAIGTSLIIMLVHGLVEDTVYGSPALPFLLLLPGLAVASSLPVGQIDGSLTNSIALRVAGVTLLCLVIIILGWMLALGQTPKSLWLANQGALRMARVELDGWPSGKWVENFNIAELQPAESSFEQALDDSENRTALYRLGLIAMLDRDYKEAVDHLAAADRLGSSHRGIRKNLAFSYVWTGRFEQAKPLLVEFEEAQQELSTYGWWWETQDQPELADRAFLMAEWLESAREQIRE